MTRPEAIAIIKRAFAALTSAQQANLRYHARKKTPIGCGPVSADRYVSPRGYG